MARLDRKAPLGNVRVDVGRHVLWLQVRTTGRSAEVRLRSDGHTPWDRHLRLRVNLAPLFLATVESDAVLPLHWGLAPRGSLGDPSDFFGYALRWCLRELEWSVPRSWRRLAARALSALLREAAALLSSQLDRRRRALMMRFPAARRTRLYGLTLRDDRGWLQQAMRSSPGPVLYAAALSGLRETEVAGLRLLEDLRSGRRLDDALDAASAAWQRSLCAWARTASPWPDGARRAFAAAEQEAPDALVRAQRVLVRRAGPHVDPRLLLLPPPVRLVPEDVPAESRANAAWFEVMKVPGVTVPAAGLGLGAAHQAAFAAFASRHAAALRPCPPGLSLDAWLLELSTLLQHGGRVPSRNTDPAEVLRGVDVGALRLRPQPVRPRFVHPLDRPRDEGRTVEALDEAHERAVDPPLCRRVFQPWTVSGAEVVQLTTLGELRAEGARQHNCVATYEGEVRSGRTLVFSVTAAGKRLTLALVRRRDRLVVSEYKGFANRRATAGEWDAIRPWLAQIRAIRA